MEFGSVNHTELDKIDFSLPADPAGNQTLFSGQRLKNPKVYVGLPRWGRTEWIGKLYPLQAKESEFLEFYGAHFNMVELNATHYKLTSRARIGLWADKVKTLDFKFCPKMFKDITHSGALRTKQELLKEFLDPMRDFGDHLGPIFIQVSDRYGPKNTGDLYKFLELLPADMLFFLEVRHPEWFTSDNLNNLTRKLREHKIGFIITDTTGKRECAHMNLTIPKAFIRFVTNNLHPSDFERTDRWAEKLAVWLDHGIEEIYFVVHMRDDEYSLDLAQYAIQKINEICKLTIPPLQLMP